MPLFKIVKSKAFQILVEKEGFGDEYKLRDFMAESLEEILGVRFVAKEYTINDGGDTFRIDTLGIDENNYPVIIEYKWREGEDIISQGKCYYNWLLKNRPHYDLLVKNKIGLETKMNWEYPRLILIAQGFNKFQLRAVQEDNNIELKTYTYYTPDILQIDDVYTPERLAQRRTLAPQQQVDTLDSHLNSTSPKMQGLVNNLRAKIIDLPEVKEYLGRSGIYYRANNKSFIRFEFRPTWIQLLLREPEYKIDTKKLVEDVTSNNWSYKGKIRLRPESDIIYIFGLIKQSYESTL